MKKLLLIFIILHSYCSTFSQSYFPPLTGSQWDTVSPAQLNWCTDSIPSLLDFVGSNNSKGLIVLVNGKIAIEKYYGSFTKDSIWYWASAGKSLLATIVGIAAQENSIDIQQSSTSYLDTGWTSCSSTDESKIKVVHQLSMSSGVNDNVADVDCTLPSCLTCLANPGSRWAYHNAIYTLLEDVVSSATGQSLNLYLNNKIKTKTGLTGIYLTQGYNNVYYSNARSMARFGLLALNNFVWNNDTVLKDGAYKTQMTNTSQNLNLSYGYLWWLNGKSSFMLPQSQLVFNGPLLPDAPMDLYSALGKNGQIINVIPSKKMVVIRIGDRPSNANELPMIFNNEIWKRLNHIICNSTGIENITSEVSIYPNPSNDYIFIESSKKIQSVSILNTLGQTQTVLLENHKIDISSLAVGVYTLIINTDRTTYQKTFVKN